MGDPKSNSKLSLLYLFDIHLHAADIVDLSLHM